MRRTFDHTFNLENGCKANRNPNQLPLWNSGMSNESSSRRLTPAAVLELEHGVGLVLPIAEALLVEDEDGAFLGAVLASRTETVIAAILDNQSASSSKESGWSEEERDSRSLMTQPQLLALLPQLGLPQPLPLSTIRISRIHALIRCLAYPSAVDP